MSHITQSADFIAGVAFQSFKFNHPGVAFLIKVILETEGATENVGDKLKEKALEMARLGCTIGQTFIAVDGACTRNLVEMADHIVSELDDEFSLVNEELVTLFAPNSDVSELAYFAHEIAMSVIDQDLEDAQNCITENTELILKHSLSAPNGEAIQ